MKKLILYSMLIMPLFGCISKEEAERQSAERYKQYNAPKVSLTVKNSPPEVEVTKIGDIEDYLAYNSKRGIYRIKDNKTGAEYLGISGIGITETGSHNCGKSCTRQDER